MTPYWIGILAGLFIGAIFGFTLCALLVVAKDTDKKEEQKKRE